MSSAGSSPAGPRLSPLHSALCSLPHPAERPGLVPAAAPDWTPTDRHNVLYLPSIPPTVSDLTYYDSKQRKNIFLRVNPCRQSDLLSCYPVQTFMYREAPRYCPCTALLTEWRPLCSVCCEGQKVRLKCAEL